MLVVWRTQTWNVWRLGLWCEPEQVLEKHYKLRNKSSYKVDYRIKFRDKLYFLVWLILRCITSSRKMTCWSDLSYFYSINHSILLIGSKLVNWILSNSLNKLPSVLIYVTSSPLEIRLCTCAPLLIKSMGKQYWFHAAISFNLPFYKVFNSD